MEALGYASGALCLNRTGRTTAESAEAASCGWTTIVLGLPIALAGEITNTLCCCCCTESSRVYSLEPLWWNPLLEWLGNQR